MTHLNVDVHLLLLVPVDHGPILDEQPVLGALEVNGHLLDWGDHDDALLCPLVSSGVCQWCHWPLLSAVLLWREEESSRCSVGATNDIDHTTQTLATET